MGLTLTFLTKNIENMMIDSAEHLVWQIIMLLMIFMPFNKLDSALRILTTGKLYQYMYS